MFIIGVDCSGSEQKNIFHLDIACIIIYNMKRSSAPSSRAKPKRQKSLKIVATPLKKNQLKSLHYLLSAASYITVLGCGQMAGKKIRDCCFKFYHGYDDDNIGVAKMMLAGQGRFRVLWESSSSSSGSSRIANGFGCLSGLDKASISKAILMSTLSGGKLIDGRMILAKARTALLEAKKLLAFWMEFLNNGQFPSGTNEEDALQHVFNRAYSEISVELDDDNDDDNEEEEDDHDDEEEGQDEIVDQQQYQEEDETNNDEDDGSMAYRVNDESCGTGINNDSTEGGDQIKKKRSIKNEDAPLSFFPAAMLLFMLYGPYGVGVYNLELSSALSMNTEAIDDAAFEGNMNMKSIKSAKIKEEKALR